jgi:hypothetical protein
LFDYDTTENESVTPMSGMSTKLPTINVPLSHVQIEAADVAFDEILKAQRVLHFSQLPVGRVGTIDNGHRSRATREKVLPK